MAEGCEAIQDRVEFLLLRPTAENVAAAAAEMSALCRQLQQEPRPDLSRWLSRVRALLDSAARIRLGLAGVAGGVAEGYTWSGAPPPSPVRRLMETEA